MYHEGASLAFRAAGAPGHRNAPNTNSWLVKLFVAGSFLVLKSEIVNTIEEMTPAMEEKTVRESHHGARLHVT